MMTAGDTIDAQDLPPYLQDSSEPAEPGSVPLPTVTLAEAARAQIIRVLRETGDVIGTAATRLGVPRTTSNGLMRKLKISRHDL